MWFGKVFFKRHAGTVIKRVLFALAVVGLLMGCSGNQCSIKSKRAVVRTPSDVSDFSVIFINGEATLYWVDADDAYFDRVEISWKARNQPSGKDKKPVKEKKPVKVGKGIETYVIPDLEEGTEYNFTLTTVDKWKNRSNAAKNIAGRAFKQRKSAYAEDMSIKARPTAGQVVLSWTNLNNSEYDHVEITYAPGNDVLYRVPKGVESRMLTNLSNGVEYTFYIRAVDARGNYKPINQAGIFISDLPLSPESVFGRASAGQITLVWQDPSSSRFNNIEAVYSPDGNIPVTIAKGRHTNTFTGLSDLTDYEFTLYAVDTAGHRRPITNVSLSSSLTPIFDGKDAEKTVVRGRPVGGQVKLDWEDPPMPNLDRIAIIYEPADSNTPTFVYKGLGTATLAGLADGREYRFLVYGVDTKRNNWVIPEVQLSTPRLPVLVAQPVSGRATLVWSNPEYPNFSHIVVSYKGLERGVRAAKGAERFTFTGLSDYEEYEFRVTAVTTEGNTHAVIPSRVSVARLPVLTGKPVNRQVSLAWVDPTDITFNRVEIVYSPEGDQPRSVARGLESATFFSLSDDTEYTFLIYAVDSVGNRHPVRSPKFYDPYTTHVLHSEPSQRRNTLSPLSWRAADNTTFGNSAINALSFGIAANGLTRWVAGGSDGKLAYSNDYGINWIQVTDSTFGSYSIDCIHYANGRWIAGGRNGKMAWSTNGVLWNAVTRFNFTVNFNINAVAFGNGRWIAGGSNGSIIISEDNGVSWRRVASDVFDRSAINTIAFHDGRWMAGGTMGRIAYSDDNGLTWIAVKDTLFGNSAINIIIYDDERWIAGGYGQNIAWSEDGITWQPMARPFYIICMGFNGFRWMAGGQRGRMAWSSDGGDNWTTDEQSYNFFDDNWIQAVASGRAADGKLRWLAGGQSGKIMYADEQ